MNRSRRLAAAAMVSMLATGAAGAFVRNKTQQAAFGPAVSLPAIFPERFGDWRIDPSIMPLLPDPELQRVIDETYDQVLARTYRNEQGYRVMLSVAYGGRQTEAMNTHRPEVCYPAQGLSIRRSTWKASLDIAGNELPLRRLIAGNGARNEPITYWLVVGRNITDFGLQHKLATLKYGLTGRIPDGMLVRTSSIDENSERSFDVQDRFIQQLMADIDPAHRMRLLGAVDG